LDDRAEFERTRGEIRICDSPIIAVKFLQKLLSSESALETLYYGIAVSLVSVSLTIFNYVGEKEKEEEIKMHKESEKDEKRAGDLNN
jgi:hypothetical protein